ncbi:MAG TPA: flippase-like domain-containing protein [Candidatus Binatia bacterium]|nr:flippase-like domain-containing protein [Candidatus Binatia bacterium]
MKVLRLLLLLVGLAFLIALVAENDPAAVFASVTRLSWRIVVILTFPMALVMALDALGWRYAFLHDRVPFGPLLATRLAGEAFNIATPTAALGGEVVKAWLLRDRVPLEESVPSVIIAKTTITIAQGIFLLLGIVLAVIVLAGSRLLLAMEWLLTLEVIALAVFIVLQTRGLVGWGTRLLDRLGLRRMGATGTAARVDAALADFYRREPRRLALSILYHLAAWLLGIVETWLILWFLGIPVSLTTATVIEAFGTGIRFATFLIPGSLGAQEGGYVMTFLALGLSGADGVSFGLVRRLRELVWVAIGLALFAAMRRGTAVTAAG